MLDVKDKMIPYWMKAAHMRARVKNEMEDVRKQADKMVNEAK